MSANSPSEERGVRWVFPWVFPGVVCAGFAVPLVFFVLSMPWGGQLNQCGARAPLAVVLHVLLVGYLTAVAAAE